MDLSSTPRGVALFIDADNLSARHAGALRAVAGRLGPLRIVRAYGNASHSAWRAEPGIRFCDAWCGKNAADLLLAVESMQVALTTDPGAIVIATADGDFRHVALALREAGRRIMGIGDAKAPETFRAACTEFHELPSPTAAPPTIESRVVDLLRERGGSVPLPELNALVRRSDPTFRITATPEKSWPKWIDARPETFRRDKKGPAARVTLPA
ncbi:NYN domain-containing protein [uncultured Jannaschia sp.]|uniref:NYN domain-containing protein n=1 Tax=uncultured Jannaschia sp. TaxID=293347 RepID=UPI002632767E|nr:NYN domain-containing protein [uncultured Jannaschia sp.]